jgi:hypothetical protein
MKLTHHQNPETLRDLMEPLLLARESQNNLFLGLLILYTRDPSLQREDQFWFSIEDDGEIVLAGWRTPPLQFGLWAPEENVEPARQCFVDYLRENEKEVPGVVARKDVADAFSKLARTTFNLETFFNMEQGLYECTEVDDSLLGTGIIRKVTDEQVDLLTDWTIAFYIEVLNREPLRSETRERLTGEIKAGMHYFYMIDGHPVASAACARPMQNGITVNMVFTPEAFRRKGYATACVARLTKKLLEEGWKFTALYTDLSNSTSNNIYKKIGYRWVGESAEYRFMPARLKKS